MKWFPYSQHFFREYEGPNFLCLQGDFIKKKWCIYVSVVHKREVANSSHKSEPSNFSVLISFLTGKVWSAHISGQEIGNHLVSDKVLASFWRKWSWSVSENSPTMNDTAVEHANSTTRGKSFFAIDLQMLCWLSMGALVLGIGIVGNVLFLLMIKRTQALYNHFKIVC